MLSGQSFRNQFYNSCPVIFLSLLYPGIVIRKLKWPSWAAISKSRRRIPCSVFSNNIKRLSISHIYEMNCAVLARREMDAYDGWHIVLIYNFSPMTIWGLYLQSHQYCVLDRIIIIALPDTCRGEIKTSVQFNRSDIRRPHFKIYLGSSVIP
jgi:hypothetical protein